VYKYTTDIDFDDEIFNEALIKIDDACILISGKNLKHWGLTLPKRLQLDQLNITKIRRETSYNIAKLNEFININKPLLINDQQLAYNKIMNVIEKK